MEVIKIFLFYGKKILYLTNFYFSFYFYMLLSRQSLRFIFKKKFHVLGMNAKN